MTYEEFFADIEDKFYVEDGYVTKKWMTGGAWGGSCWGGNPGDYSPSADKEPDLTVIDYALETYTPDIKFSKAKKVFDLVEYDDETQHEYYGNHTNYGIKRISVARLYEFIQEMKG